MMIRKALPFLIVLVLLFGDVELGRASNFPTCEGSPLVGWFSKEKIKTGTHAIAFAITIRLYSREAYG